MYINVNTKAWKDAAGLGWVVDITRAHQYFQLLSFSGYIGGLYFHTVWKLAVATWLALASEMWGKVTRVPSGGGIQEPVCSSHAFFPCSGEPWSLTLGWWHHKSLMMTKVLTTKCWAYASHVGNLSMGKKEILVVLSQRCLEVFVTTS